MSNEVVITIGIALPDGAVSNVEYHTGQTGTPVSQGQSNPPPAGPADEPDFIAEAAAAFPDAVMQAPVAVATPACPTHGLMKRYPAGTNKAGKPYNASWRCSTRDCATKAIWDRDAA